MAVTEAELTKRVSAPVPKLAHLLGRKLCSAYEAVVQSIWPEADNAWLVNAQLDLCRQITPYFVFYLLGASFLIS